MGAELGALYSQLWNECAWLHARWAEYRALFGTSPERAQLLDQTARLFFTIIHDGLLDATLLHLCRLTDPPVTGSKTNLTLARLPDLVKPQIRTSTQAYLVSARDATRFARDWRN